MAGLLAEETVASTLRGATVVKMSDMMTASQKRAYAKPEVEMEHGVGTGLLSEEMQERRKRHGIMLLRTCAGTAPKSLSRSLSILIMK